MADFPQETSNWITGIVAMIVSFLGGAAINWYNLISKDKRLARKTDIENARKDLEELVKDLRKEVEEKEERVEALVQQVLVLSTTCARLEGENNFLKQELNKINGN